MKLTGQMFLILALLLCATPGTSILTKAQTDEWKAKNDRGDRYEGLISIQTGNLELEVLSFTGVKERFGKENVNLKVKFFSHTQVSLSIIAQEIETQRQYYMKVKQERWSAGAWHKFDSWPTKDVINKEDISWENVGVLISDGGNRLTPALVYHSNAPTTIDTYRMHLRTNNTFRNVRLSLHGSSDKGRPKVTKWPLAMQMGNMPFYTDLRMRGYGEGPMRLVIELQPMKPTDKTSVHEYLFYHSPRVR